MHYNDITKLEILAKKNNFKIDVVSKRLDKIIYDNIRYKIVFVIGIFCYVILLVYFSSIVWIIDIDGNSTISEVDIRNVCTQNNLKLGTLIRNVDGKNITEALKNKFKNIAWINTSIEGTRVHIKLTEGIVTNIQKADSLPTNIVASTNGIISSIVTDKGTPMVKKDDVVKKGDILISGNIKNTGNEEIIVDDYVHSEGSVRAIVTKNVNFKINLKTNEKFYTGKEVNRYAISLWDKKINDCDTLNSKNYDMTKSVKQIKLSDDINLPIIVYKFTFREYNVKERIMTVEQAKLEANRQMLNYIIDNYPTTSDIISCKTSYSTKNNVLTLNADITSDDDIAVEQIITIGGNLEDESNKNTDPS